MTTTTEAVTFGGWICTGRFMGACKVCKTFIRVEREPAQRHDDFVTCPSCGKVNVLRQVFGSVKLSKKCDARCTNARGHDCECSCGGENHGADR